jgi:hypothetical protein
MHFRIFSPILPCVCARRVDHHVQLHQSGGAAAKRLITLALATVLLSCAPVFAQSHYSCQTAAGTAIGGSFSNYDCESYTTNGNDDNTVSGVETKNPVAGDWVIAFLGHCVVSSAATACPELNGSNGALNMTDSLGNAAAGQVTTNGVDVYWDSGQWFSMAGVHSGGCNWIGGTISINRNQHYARRLRWPRAWRNRHGHRLHGRAGDQLVRSAERRHVRHHYRQRLCKLLQLRHSLLHAGHGYFGHEFQHGRDLQLIRLRLNGYRRMRLPAS